MENAKRVHACYKACCCCCCCCDLRFFIMHPHQAQHSASFSLRGLKTKCHSMHDCLVLVSSQPISTMLPLFCARKNDHKLKTRSQQKSNANRFINTEIKRWFFHWRESGKIVHCAAVVLLQASAGEFGEKNNKLKLVSSSSWCAEEQSTIRLASSCEAVNSAQTGKLASWRGPVKS